MSNYYFQVVPAYKVQNLGIKELLNAYRASEQGLYVTSGNCVHRWFLDKVVNKDYVMPD